MGLSHLVEVIRYHWYSDAATTDATGFSRRGRGHRKGGDNVFVRRGLLQLVCAMILPQVHLRKPCYDFSFL
jgi:hypothetical protein